MVETSAAVGDTCHQVEPD